MGHSSTLGSYDGEIKKLRAECARLEKDLDAERQKARQAAHGAVNALAQLEKQQEKSEAEQEALRTEVARLEKQLERSTEEAENQKEGRLDQVARAKEAQEGRNKAEAVLVEERRARQSELDQHRKDHSELKAEAARVAHELESAHAQMKNREASAARRQAVARKSLAAAVKAVKERLERRSGARIRTLKSSLGAAQKGLAAALRKIARLEPALERERRKARRAMEQLALPGRIEKEMAGLGRRIRSIQARGAAARMIALQAGESVSHVERLIVRLANRLSRA